MSGIYDSQAGNRVVTFWIAAVVAIALGLAFGVPAWRKHRIQENERAAFKAMQLLVTAEADFRANDRDGNKVNDFWTGDVAGLHFLSPGGLPLELIPKSLAEADAAPLVPRGSGPVPYKGYYFRALAADGSETPPEVYRQETDKTSGKVHHPSKFGFVAYPAEPGVTGTLVLVVNENITVFPKHIDGPPPVNFPTDEELKWYFKE